MRDEYAAWKALDARVTAAGAGEGPPLSPADEARWGELMEGWPLALQQAMALEADPRSGEAVLGRLQTVTQGGRGAGASLIGLVRERRGIG